MRNLAKQQEIIHFSSATTLMGVTVRAPAFPRFPVGFAPSYSTTIESLQEFYKNTKRLLVLTGAGISTDSGIPDYRSPGRAPSNPVLYHDFISSLDVRKRYWGRGLIGYTSFSSTKPNAGHKLVADMENTGKIRGIITQNVDGYHQDVGSKEVLELHGNLHRVKCLDCEFIAPRAEFQENMKKNNLEFYEQYSKDYTEKKMKADGDAELNDFDFSKFVLPRCAKCDGVNVRPDIVFMGGYVDSSVRDQATQWTSESDGVLVIGSTLTVYSAFRLIRLAKSLPVPISVINEGLTRADPLADIKIEARITQTLQQLVKS